MVNHLAQRQNIADDQLGLVVAGAGLGGKDEHTRGHCEVGIVHDAVIQHMDMQGI